jgi:hypothetical protein
MRYFPCVLAATSSMLLLTASPLCAQPAAVKGPPKDFQGTDILRLSVEKWSAPKGNTKAPTIAATYTLDVGHHSSQFEANKAVWSLRFEPWGLGPPALLAPCGAWVSRETGWLIIGKVRRQNPVAGEEDHLEVLPVNGATALARPIEGVPLERLPPSMPVKEFATDRATVKVQRAAVGDFITMTATINIKGQEPIRITQKWKEGECWWREYVREINGHKDLHARFHSVLTRTQASREKALREDPNAFFSWDHRFAVKVTLVKDNPTFADVADVIKKRTGVTLTLDESLREYVPRCGGCSFRDAPACVLIRFMARQGYHHARWEDHNGGIRLKQASTMTDNGLKQMVGREYVTSLNLFNTQVTDAGLKELAGLRNITALDLANTKITDAGLKELASLKEINRLDLEGTQVTDTGLYAIVGLTRLVYLNLHRTRVTDAAIKELRKAIPDCNIVR